MKNYVAGGLAAVGLVCVTVVYVVKGSVPVELVSLAGTALGGYLGVTIPGGSVPKE